LTNKEKNEDHSGNYEAGYIGQGLVAFRELRRAGRILLNSYVSRLATEASSLAVDPPKVLIRPNETSGCRSWLTDHLKGTLNKAICVINFIRLMPSFMTQKRKLDLMQATPEVLCNVIIAIASERLHCAKGDTPRRQYWTSLARNFPGRPNKPDIANEISASKYVLVFDPLPLSPLWNNREECWRDGVFIVDTGFLFFVVVISIFKIAGRWLRYCSSSRVFYQALHPGSIRASRTLRDIIVASMIVEGCKEVIDGSHNIKAFFFTSNSFVTEILRMYLIQHSPCVAICEVLHGVPTKDWERYLATLLDLGAEYGAYKKHYFIPQIPDLPMYGIFNAQSAHDSRMAINTYLNKYLIERESANQKLTDFVESEYNAIFPQDLAFPDPLIISLTGGMAHDLDYLGSDVFRIECLIILHVKNVLSRIKQSFFIIYTPHPGHEMSKFFGCKFFVDEKVLVYRDTIFTWLIADMCIALQSSALFEATYCGVKSFTPMKASDEIYPPSLLDLLHHPEGETRNNGLVEGLTSFLLAHANRSTSVDLLLRAKERLKLLS